MNDQDRREVRAILMMVLGSDLRIIDPDLHIRVAHAIDLVTTDSERARVDEMRARLARVRAERAAEGK